jgi:organic hydroperoxide reductase OsmC/OhrA
VVFANQPPTAQAVASLHEIAHRECFIANSVQTSIRVVEDGRPGAS